jgi:1,2-diacylglycerol 3-alpha-glucosyltransferase
MTILFFLRRIGPYHHARFSEAAKLVNLVAVQTRPSSQEYAWDFKPTGSYSIESFDPITDPEHGLRGTALVISVQRTIDKHKPDVIVNTGWADAEYNEVVIQAAKGRLPLVVISDSRYEDEPRKFYKEWVKKLLIRSYSAALVAGSASRKYAVALGLDPASVFQPWDVVDNNYFKPLAKSPLTSESGFICVARFITKKNHSRLLDAFAAYRNGGGLHKLTLLGNGELEDTLRRQCDALGIASHVAFAGFAQQESLRQYLHNSIALILPSTSDQWGLVVNEGMASGIPVLVSRECGCAADLVRDSVNGFIFDPFDISSIVEGMNRIDRLSEQELADMGNAARETIVQWSLQAFASGLVDACTYAIKAPRRTPFTAMHKRLTR